MQHQKGRINSWVLENKGNINIIWPEGVNKQSQIIWRVLPVKSEQIIETFKHTQKQGEEIWGVDAATIHPEECFVRFYWLHHRHSWLKLSTTSKVVEKNQQIGRDSQNQEDKIGVPSPQTNRFISFSATWIATALWSSAIFLLRNTDGISSFPCTLSWEHQSPIKADKYADLCAEGSFRKGGVSKGHQVLYWGCWKRQGERRVNKNVQSQHRPVHLFHLLKKFLLELRLLAWGNQLSRTQRNFSSARSSIWGLFQLRKAHSSGGDPLLCPGLRPG